MGKIFAMHIAYERLINEHRKNLYKFLNSFKTEPKFCMLRQNGYEKNHTEQFLFQTLK